jgi:homoserine kinase
MRKLTKVKAKAYATIANLGPGFDVFGISVNVGYDLVELESTDKESKLEVGGVGARTIPTDFDRNTAGLVAKHVLNDFKVKQGVNIHIQKGVKPGSGLGSSAASAAATAVALDRLLGLHLSQFELIRYAALGEIASAGVAHADNVAPAILGGFTIVRSYIPLEVVKLNPPKNLSFCIATPNLELPTREARAVLPKEIPLQNLVHNVGNAASLVVGMIKGDLDLIGRSMDDIIVEPARARLIPGYYLVKNYAKEAGAVGVTIGGAGPSMIAVVDPKKVNPIEVAQAMKRGFGEAGVNAEANISKPAAGATVLEVK